LNILRDPNFRSLPDTISPLFGAASDASFFNLPEWYDVVARNGLEPGWKPVLIADGDAAFVLKERSAASALLSCVTPYTCEHAILAVEPVAVARLAESIARAMRGRYRVQLTGLDPSSPAFAAAMKGFRAGGLATKPFFAWSNWHEDVAGESFEQYVAARPSNLVNTWKRKRASLTKTERWSIDILAPDENPEPFIADYEKVHRESWKKPEPFPEFLPALIKRAATLGALRAGVLKIAGEPAAAQFWIVWQKKALIFKLVHADKFNSFSPGTILTMDMIKHIFATDAPVSIDFGRGDDNYKKLWVSSRRERWGIDAANPRTVRGALLSGKIALAKMRDRIRRSSS
jgi:hypothetical protein